MQQSLKIYKTSECIERIYRNLWKKTFIEVIGTAIYLNISSVRIGFEVLGEKVETFIIYIFQSQSVR